MSDRQNAGTAQSAGDTERFDFDVGDCIKEQSSVGFHVEGVGKVTDTFEYEITHRLVDADNETAYYRVTYEDGPNVREAVKDAEMVHSLYRSVDTGTDRDGGSRD